MKRDSAGLHVTASKGAKDDMDERLQEAIRQYETAAAFATEFMAELGKARALPIIRRAFAKMQIKAAKELAARLGGNSFQDFAEWYEYRKRTKDNPNVEILEITDRHIALRINACLAAEAFKHFGCPEVCRQYCDADHDYIEAFNPMIKLKRTKTIADGTDHCDHIWALEE